MERVIGYIQAILDSPYTNMFLALVFMFTSVDAIITNYKSDITDISIHHGIALYGLVMFLKSVISALQAIVGIDKARGKWKKH